MKIFSWIRNKRNGNEVTNKPNPESKSHDTILHHESCKDEFSDWPNGLLTIGTFGNGNHKQSEKHDTSEFGNICVEELLDCLHDDEEREKKDTQLQRTSTGVAHRGRKDHRSGNIGKKSLSFLIKKSLLCNGGFVPTPVLKDPLPDPRLDHSRMDKILRAMLHKKIYPQKPTPKTKKYLDKPEIDSDEEEDQRSNNSKWVKTDSEYIVLEI